MTYSPNSTSERFWPTCLIPAARSINSVASAISLKEAIGVPRFFVLALLSLFVMPASSAVAAELIMVRQPGCHWCLLWDKEIGSIYSKSEESRFAPVRHVDIRGPLPTFLKKPVTITPTFILIENDREIDRMIGYPGKDFFWELLSEMLAKSSFHRAPQR